jgi:hypothetical protein
MLSSAASTLPYDPCCICNTRRSLGGSVCHETMSCSRPTGFRSNSLRLRFSLYALGADPRDPTTSRSPSHLPKEVRTSVLQGRGDLAQRLQRQVQWRQELHRWALPRCAPLLPTPLDPTTLPAVSLLMWPSPDGSLVHTGVCTWLTFGVEYTDTDSNTTTGVPVRLGIAEAGTLRWAVRCSDGGLPHRWRPLLVGSRWLVVPAQLGAVVYSTALALT